MDTLTPTEIQFVKELREAGFTVNQFTFADGQTLPTVYGSAMAVRRKTSVPIAAKPMGNFEIVYPLVSGKK
jgi:hypothetical protein